MNSHKQQILESALEGLRQGGGILGARAEMLKPLLGLVYDCGYNESARNFKEGQSLSIYTDIASNYWRNGPTMNERIQELAEQAKARCDALLVAMVGEFLAPKWWSSPNQAFDGEIPERVFETDQEKVYRYLLNSSEGEW